jgi:hypothetical protein
MDTTIQISNTLKKELLKRKFFTKETYEEVIWDLIEDNQELSEQTKKEIAQSRAEYKAGKIHSLEKIKKEMKK